MHAGGAATSVVSVNRCGIRREATRAGPHLPRCFGRGFEVLFESLPLALAGFGLFLVQRRWLPHCLMRSRRVSPVWANEESDWDPLTPDGDDHGARRASAGRPRRASTRPRPPNTARFAGRRAALLLGLC